LERYGELPIYLGDHERVSAFAETLADAMVGAASHVYDRCGGKVPRWMQVPKVHFGVTRLNIAQSVAKASQRFSSVTALLAKCGPFPEDDLAKVQAWLVQSELAEVVAHKPFVDMRAYVFTSEAEGPTRVRFYEAGLVIARSEGFVLQDHRNTLRRPRNDAYKERLAANDSGWTVFGTMGKYSDAAHAADKAPLTASPG
jgi:hypothetical protein